MQKNPTSDSTMREGADFFLCTDLLCRSRFTTKRGLYAHLTTGKHKYFKNSETIVEYGAKVFANLAETSEAVHLAVRHDSIGLLSSTDGFEENKTGWALRRSERAANIDGMVKKEVERMVIERLERNQRAEAREISQRLRDLKNEDGSGDCRFPIKKCLNESQVKTQIGRILKSRKKEEEKQEKLEGTSDEANNGQNRKLRGRKRSLQEMEQPNAGTIEDNANDEYDPMTYIVQ
ncbi:hypothetical protein PFISCL1PPCAC_15486 [Pristionchus fissidentatus]|uniref:C2H2-type domain-containing protein n=1 Tax=Pristionchus fissidentatus TaxID=1538716 RepID=A0AAV5W2P1_9BILA|nr:hypothetical protein PFISCL1PPCAC_15486 [Pristionchus fissidentatus]